MNAWYEPDGVYGRRYEILPWSYSAGVSERTTLSIQEVDGACRHIGPVVSAEINYERFCRDGKYSQNCLSALRRKSDALVLAGVVQEGKQ